MARPKGVKNKTAPKPESERSKYIGGTIARDYYEALMTGFSSPSAALRHAATLRIQELKREQRKANKIANEPKQ